MNELDELKKKWTETRQILHALLKSEVERLSSWLAAKKEEKDFLLRLGATVVVASLAIGFFVGFIATKGGEAGPAGTLSQPPGASFWFPWFGRKQDLFAGVQADGSFLISNFEKPADLEVWKPVSTQITSSTHYAWEGSRSAQVSYLAGKELAAVTLNDLGRMGKEVSDWSAYESLQFYLFHSGTQTESLTFLVTDLWGKRYEETLNIPRGRWIRFVIPVSKIAASLSIEKINQLSISRRTLGEALDFYFDDIRLLPLASGGAKVSAEKIFDYGFLGRKPAWTVPDPQASGEVVRVPFILRNETNAFCHLCPAEGGMPFPMGELHDPNALRIRNAHGEDLPFQTRVLAWWPDRSIKWLDIHMQSTLPPGAGTGYFLEYGPNIRSMEFESPLKVTEDETSIRIHTGPMETVLSKKNFYLFDQVTVDQNGDGKFEPEEKVTANAPLVLRFQGREYRTDLDTSTYKIEVEEKGSQRVVVRASGWFQSEEGGRFSQAVVRYYFYQGKSTVKVSHTLVYTGYPANEQYAAYRMLRLPPNEAIEAYGIRIPYPFSEKKDEQVFVGLTKEGALRAPAGASLRLFQKDYGLALLEHNNVPAASPAEPFGGWLGLSNGEKGLAVALRHFRENFPKAFKLDRAQGEIAIDLWPQEAGLLDLSTTPRAVGPDAYGRGNAFGLAKTHDLLFYFHAGDTARSNAAHVAASFMEPLRVRANPFWIDATGALGRLYPADPKYATEEKMLERLFDWAARQPQQFQWYGMLDFGDTLTWIRDEDEDRQYGSFDWNPVGRWGWYNCEGVGTHTGALLQFARSGDWKYFEFGENVARHVMDIDTVHYDTVTHDKRLHQINPRYSQVGAMHRHNGDHWGGRTDEASHTSVVGILLYYYLSGNERALDVAKEVGEYFLKEPFTYIDRPDVVPHRAMAHALWGDVLLYQATWDERYKKAAEKIIKIYLKGQQSDGSFLENYNPILGRWGGEKHELYMSGYLLGALMSYHELTQEEPVKEMLLRLVRYLAPRPYTGPTILHGIAYAYLITRDPFFVTMAERNLKDLLAHQVFSSDPLHDGLIYEKPIYHRPMALLSTVPYVFGVLEEYYQSLAVEK